MSEYISSMNFEDEKSVVALNLSDLVNEKLQRDIYSSSCDENHNTNSVNVNQRHISSTLSLPNENSVYQQELSKLLLKSKGTPYEAAIRRFTESKSSPQTQQAVYNIQNEHNTSSYSTTQRPKIDLFNLSKSRYDSSPSQNHSTRTNNIQIIDSDCNDTPRRLDELAKPLQAQSWRGPYVGYGNDKVKRVSTNHLGRQRPPSVINNSSNYNKNYNASTNTVSVSMSDFNKWFDSNQEWKSNQEKKIAHKSAEQDKILRQPAVPKIDPNSDKMSLKFIEKDILRLSQELKEGPMAFAKSKSHDRPGNISPSCNESASDASSARRGRPTERQYYSPQMSKKLSRSLTPQSSSSVDMPKRSYGSTLVSGINNSIAASSKASNGSSNENKREELNASNSGVNCVFDRLALQGLVKAKRYRSWTPPPKTGSFKPEINDRSRLLGEKFRSRIESSPGRASPTPWKAGASSSTPSTPNVSPPSSSHHHRYSNSRSPSPSLLRSHSRDRLSYLSHSISSRVSERTSSSPLAGVSSPIPPPPPGRPMQHQQGQQKQLPSVHQSIQSLRLSDLGIVTPKISKGRSPSPSRSGKQRVIEGLQQSRHRSSSAAERKRLHSPGNTRLKPEFIETSRKPFQPVLIASETTRIINRQSQTFGDRLVKSVEDFYVRKAVAERSSCSPGPGHYSNSIFQKCDTLAVSPPLRAGGLKSVAPSAAVIQNRNPGGDGHKFGKETRLEIFPKQKQNAFVNSILNKGNSKNKKSTIISPSNNPKDTQQEEQTSPTISSQPPSRQSSKLVINTSDIDSPHNNNNDSTTNTAKSWSMLSTSSANTPNANNNTISRPGSVLSINSSSNSSGFSRGNSISSLNNNTQFNSTTTSAPTAAESIENRFTRQTLSESIASPRVSSSFSNPPSSSESAKRHDSMKQTTASSSSPSNAVTPRASTVLNNAQSQRTRNFSLNINPEKKTSIRSTSSFETDKLFDNEKLLNNQELDEYHSSDSAGDSDEGSEGNEDIKEMAGNINRRANSLKEVIDYNTEIRHSSIIDGNAKQGSRRRSLSVRFF